MKHHHKNGVLLLVLVALVLWWVYRSHVATGPAAGGTGGTQTTGGGTSATSPAQKSVIAQFGLPAWKLNQSPLKYNELQPDYQRSLDFYTAMYFPFDVDSSTGVGARGGYLPSNRFWQISSDQELIRA